jgi:hypothetical protein
VYPTSEHKDQKWESKVNEDNLKIHIRHKGSELTKDFPMVMSDMYFKPGPGITLKNLIKAIHNPLERKKWDKDVEMGRIIEMMHDSKALLFH